VKHCLLALTASVLYLFAGVGVAAADPPPVASQTVQQTNGNEQASAAAAAAAQTNPSNQNISIRVLSPGNDGPVTQGNTVESNATSSNANQTQQNAGQEQAAGSANCCPAAPSLGVQTIDQANSNEQASAALSAALQENASNTNVPVRVLSPSEGEGAPVTQTNSVESNATSTNSNSTNQTGDQSQGGSAGIPAAAAPNPCCPAGSTGIQTAKQENANEQGSFAGSVAAQENPENKNISIRVLSPGNDGPVSQTNSVESNATSSNTNRTDQSTTQNQGAGGAPMSSAPAPERCCPSGSTGIQVAGQGNESSQHSAALSGAFQSGASNVNVPIRVLSEGNNGPVSQTNSASSSANSSNSNSTSQTANQSQQGQGGSSHGCCGSGALGIQVAGQGNESTQHSGALSAAIQDGASNTNAPLRVLSPGHDGPVSQSNNVESNATSSNSNRTGQSLDQSQNAGGAGGLGIQVAGQGNESFQGSAALSAGIQKGAENSNSPLRVLSWGGSGGVTQENNVSSDASSSNSNATSQHVGQEQSKNHSPLCCFTHGTGIQVAGQHSANAQGSFAGSLAAQIPGRDRCGCPTGGNENAPLRVLSPGWDGAVSQANNVHSGAESSNSNQTDQSATQGQSAGTRGCCPGGTGVQVIGQGAANGQLSAALGAALQLGAANGNSPLGVLSPGGLGSLEQLNGVEGLAGSANQNGTRQNASQHQAA
jgi:hypothetical protein